MINLDATKHVPAPMTDEQRRAQIVYRDYTHGQLTDAFELVQNKEHWKLPIDTVLPTGVTLAQVELIEAAIVYFTGGGSTVRRFHATGQIRVTAPGYYASIGA